MSTPDLREKDRLLLISHGGLVTVFLTVGLTESLGKNALMRVPSAPHLIHRVKEDLRRALRARWPEIQILPDNQRAWTLFSCSTFDSNAWQYYRNIEAILGWAHQGTFQLSTHVAIRTHSWGFLRGVANPGNSSNGFELTSVTNGETWQTFKRGFFATLFSNVFTATLAEVVHARMEDPLFSALATMLFAKHRRSPDPNNEENDEDAFLRWWEQSQKRCRRWEKRRIGVRWLGENK